VLTSVAPTCRQTPRCACPALHTHLNGWMSTGNCVRVSVRVASSSSYGRPSNRASSRSSQRSRACRKARLGQHCSQLLLLAGALCTQGLINCTCTTQLMGNAVCCSDPQQRALHLLPLPLLSNVLLQVAISSNTQQQPAFQFPYYYYCCC
jgi:hypothetical protein